MNVQPPSHAYSLNIPGMKEKKIIHSEGPDSPWVELKATWKHLITVKNEAREEKRISKHKYTYVVKCDGKGNGKIYNNDEKETLAIKLGALSIGTPLFYAFKTLYHTLLPISLTHQIYKTVKDFNKEVKDCAELKLQAPKDLAKRVVKVIVKSLIDIVKTPLYLVALTVIALSCLVLSAISTKFLYRGREAYGEVMDSLNWNNRRSIWTLAPCMLNLGTLDRIAKQRAYEMPDTVYDGEKGTVIHGLNNLTRSLYMNLISIEEQASRKAWKYRDYPKLNVA